MKLSPDISRQLHDLCKSPIASVYRNARIILLAANGMPVSDIAHVLGVSARSVKNTIRVFRISGIDGLTGRGAVGRPSEMTSGQRQAIIDLLRHHPSEYGIDKSRWTAADIAMVAERKGIVEKISPATVRRIVASAGLDWYAAKRLVQGKENARSIVVAEDESDDSVVDKRMSLQGLWTSVCVKNKSDQERLLSIYSTLVRRYGSRDGGNYLQLELLAVNLLNALRFQEAGDRESVDKALRIVRSHLEDLEREAALRKNRSPLPGTTPAEIASDLLERWRQAQNEDRNG